MIFVKMIKKLVKDVGVGVGESENIRRIILNIKFLFIAPSNKLYLSKHNQTICLVSIGIMLLSGKGLNIKNKCKDVLAL